MADQDLPGVLVSDLEGPHGICEDHAEDLKRHFNLITMQDFLENKAQLGPQIHISAPHPLQLAEALPWLLSPRGGTLLPCSVQ